MRHALMSSTWFAGAAATLMLVFLMLVGAVQGPLSLVQGYEGGKVYFYGVDMDYRGSRVVWKISDPVPPHGITPSSWTFKYDYFNVDPDEEAAGWQNLIGVVSTSGMFERTYYGALVSDGPVRWTVERALPDGRVERKTFEAKVYYAVSTLYLYTRVDENVFLGIGSTEKCDPVRNTLVALWVRVNNWAPLGNNTPQNFAAILGVEVMDVRVWETDTDGSGMKLREGVPEGASVQLGFHRGQMLAMYRDWDSFSMGLSSEPRPGPDFLLTLRQGQPDISPSPDLTKDVIVALPLTEFGAKSTTCGWFDKWTPPLVEVKLRTHILKVDSWIAVQKRGEPPRPPIVGVNPWTLWEGLTKWVAETFGVPLSVAGWAALILIIVFLLVVFALLSIFVALKLGVRGEHIREYRRALRG